MFLVLDLVLVLVFEAFFAAILIVLASFRTRKRVIGVVELRLTLGTYGDLQATDFGFAIYTGRMEQGLYVIRTYV